MNDLASGTSSWSTKLVHGGLRYLEYYEFRLVREALIERDAAGRGAVIRTRSRAVEIRQADGIWHLTVEDTLNGGRCTITARALVNAGGPWVEEVLACGAGLNAKAKVRLVQGSHIVV